MLGDELHQPSENLGEKSSIVNDIEDPKIIQIINEKDQLIRQLKKTVKKLTNEMKSKKDAQKNINPMEASIGLKGLLQREISKGNELREQLNIVLERIKKISFDINHEFSLSNNNETMDNLIKMLDGHNLSSKSRTIRENQSMMSSSVKSGTESVTSKEKQNEGEEEIGSVSIQQPLQELELRVSAFVYKNAEISKQYKDNLKIVSTLQQELKNLKEELKGEKKSKDLLQKLLQKNQTEKNDLVNQINELARNSEIQDLENKEKKQIQQYCVKLTYRIKDLEKEKSELLMTSTKEKQNEYMLYQNLLNKVKNIEEKSRMRQSVG